MAIFPLSYALSLDAFMFDCLTLKRPKPFNYIRELNGRMVVEFTSEQAFRDYMVHIYIFDSAA